MSTDAIDRDIEILSKTADGYEGGWELFALVVRRKALLEEERRRRSGE